MIIETPEIHALADVEYPEKTVLRKIVDLENQINVLEHRIRILKEYLKRPARIREKIRILFQIRDMEARLKQYKDRLNNI